MGITSRGLFLQLSSERIAFLTLARARGPLTVNCSGNPDEFAAIRSGSKILVRSNGMFFPETGLWIDSSQAYTWRTPAKPVHMPLADQCSARVTAVIDLLFSMQVAGRNMGLLPLLIPGAKTENTRRFQTLTDAIKAALRDRRSDIIMDNIQSLLGLGEGLTPSGDDFILGFMLVLNRWGDAFLPELDRSLLNRQLLGMIYHKTTTLSANLIECSLQEQADERLIGALDGLVTGTPEILAVVENLTAWGKTSGIDAFSGMAFAIAAR